ncbi:MAG: GTPase, partial [Pseudomonadota bacterium]
RTGFEVAIVGPPNAGKSTLLNALAGRDAAITSEIAGTTRDVIEVRMDLRGIPVTFLDTAGLRVAQDALEAAGVERAKKRAELADLRLILCEFGARPVMQAQNEDLIRTPKSDLGSGDFSALTGEGLDSLISNIADVLSKRVAVAGISIRERHRVAMMKASASLQMALDRLLVSPDMVELIADDVHQAIYSLESLVGFIGVEDILDDVFKNFCIGK